MTRTFNVITLVIAFIVPAIAFPSSFVEHLARSADAGTFTELLSGLGAAPKVAKRTGFDAAAQYVSTTGAHVFVPPDFSKGDQRGLFAFGPDVAAALAALGLSMAGTSTQWSIGGPPPPLLGVIPGGRGLSNTHNAYEGDASLSRGDLYLYGNDYKLVLSQFQELFAMQPDPATAVYDLDVMSDFRYNRYQHSIANNPNFFLAPIGVLTAGAGYILTVRAFANNSAEHPEGITNQVTLKSFFAITGDSGSFTYTEGWERIPDNWYRRALDDPITLVTAAHDLLYMSNKHPEFLAFGGNTGQTNTFTGLNLSTLTNGVFDGATLAQGNNFYCFVYQITKAFAPDILQTLAGDLTSRLNGLNTALGNAFGNLRCPQLASVDKSQLSKYPGAAGAY